MFKFRIDTDASAGRIFSIASISYVRMGAVSATYVSHKGRRSVRERSAIPVRTAYQHR